MSVLVWVLVIAASTSQNSPMISPPVYHLASCQAMQTVVDSDSHRVSKCVEIRMWR
jgi:hypothetical protein